MCVYTRESERKRKSLYGILVGSSLRPSDWVCFFQGEVFSPSFLPQRTHVEKSLEFEVKIKKVRVKVNIRYELLIVI